MIFTRVVAINAKQAVLITETDDKQPLVCNFLIAITTKHKIKASIRAATTTTTATIPKIIRRRDLYAR